MTHTDQTAERLMVLWRYITPEAEAAIRKRFNIPDYTTVNGMSPAEISVEDMPVLVDCERRGYLSIIKRKWQKIGGKIIL